MMSSGFATLRYNPHNYVHVKTADLYRPNARLTPERQGYQVLTPFGKLGYSQKY